VKRTAWDAIMDLKNPDEMFDLVCAGCYFAGNLDGMMPVDESRKVFEKIKKLLRKPRH
jgi:hypothetical protein